MATAHIGTGAMSKSRVEAFSDGVFAIVITLLAFDIKVPQATDATLTAALVAMWPKFFVYLLSFVNVGMYWVGHHNIFHGVMRVDRPLLWLNNFLLMIVALVPFAASLLAEHNQAQVSVILYGCLLILIGIAMYLVWWYAFSHGMLQLTGATARIHAAVRRRILFAPLVSLISIGVSFVSVRASMFLYLLGVATYLLPGEVDRYAKAKS
jgi:uncharacterized membrane protein